MTSRELWFLHLLWSMLIAFAVTQLEQTSDEAHCLNDCNPLPILAPPKKEKPSAGTNGAVTTTSLPAGGPCYTAAPVPGSTTGALMAVATPCGAITGSTP